MLKWVIRNKVRLEVTKECGLEAVAALEGHQRDLYLQTADAVAV